VLVSRHSIRTPYGPTNGTVSDFSSYSPLAFPTSADWNMTEYEFENQYITPQGAILMQRLGSYYRERWGADGLSQLSCEQVTCFADFGGSASRDVDSASAWLEGFAICPDVPILLVNDTTNPAMQGVLSDHYQIAPCELATEDQVMGTFGGNPDSLTTMYQDGIQKVVEVLQMTGSPGAPFEAPICKNVNPTYDLNPVTNCTLMDIEYSWYGEYFGEFQSPMYLSSYFAEAWMFQYLSNLETYAFGQLDLATLRDLYSMHIENLWLGTNIWNSLAYSSQQLGYIVASLDQMVTSESVPGVPQAHNTQLVLLFSHDTNILFLRKLLDLNWIPIGHGNNVATPGGALNFELHKDDKTADYFVKIVYIAASPEQQRSGVEMNLTHPPAVATLVIPDCGEEYCPWEQFKEIALGKIAIECTEEPLQSALYALLPAEETEDEGSSCSTSQMGMVAGATIGGYTLLLAVIGWVLVSNGTISINRSKSAHHSPYETVEKEDKNEALMASGDSARATYVPPVTSTMHTGGDVKL
jgi:hypothetical protein